MSQGLSWEEFRKQFEQYHVDVLDCEGYEIESIHVRTEAGDYGVAAVHLDGKTLVIDMGHIVLGEITQQDIDWAHEKLKGQPKEGV